MNVFDYVRPLPQGTTTATLRRVESILDHCNEPESLLVRVFGVDDANAMKVLLQQHFSETNVQVYVYPVTHDVEVEMIADGTKVSIKKCKIERTGDILKPLQVDESSRRRWREVIQSLLSEPNIIDLPCVESHALLFRWLKEAGSRLDKPLLMDDYIDALLAMLQVKVASPVDESFVVRTTAQAGVMFVASLRGTDPVTLKHILSMTEAMFTQGMSLTPETLLALDNVIWSSYDHI